jgi:hypothetical protein
VYRANEILGVGFPSEITEACDQPSNQYPSSLLDDHLSVSGGRASEAYNWKLCFRELGLIALPFWRYEAEGRIGLTSCKQL